MSLSATRASLLERIAGGDAAAFQEVVREYGDLIWSLASRFARTRADTEDAVQDIFTCVWQSAGRYHPQSGPEVTFISVLARRRLIDRWRRDARAMAAAEINEAIARAAADRVSFSASDVDAAMAVFEGLNEKQQTALRLSICFGLTHEQIAAATGTPLGTVKTTIRSAIMRIRERLEAKDAAAGATQR